MIHFLDGWVGEDRRSRGCGNVDRVKEWLGWLWEAVARIQGKERREACVEACDQIPSL